MKMPIYSYDKDRNLKESDQSNLSSKTLEGQTWKCVDFGPEAMAMVHVFSDGSTIEHFGKDWKESDEPCKSCDAEQERVKGITGREE